MKKKPEDEKKPKKIVSHTDEELKALKKEGVVRSYEQDRFALKRKVRMFYDLQRMRLQVLGRIAPKAEGAAIQLHPYDLAILERRGQDLHTAEKWALEDVKDHLKTMPFYVNVLSNKKRYKGIGPTLAGVILAENDIRRQSTPSKMWSFAGLAPVAAFRCKECNSLVEQTGENGSSVFHHSKVIRRSFQKEGEEKEAKSKCSLAPKLMTKDDVYESGKSMRPTRGEKLKYNAWLRSKLVGVAGPCLLKCNSPWRKFYDDYKHRWTTAGKGINDAHRHTAAVRYMVKMLLLDIWIEWRKAEGLPGRVPYAEEKLDHLHSTQSFNENNRLPEEDQYGAEIEEELRLLEDDDPQLDA